MKFWKTNDPVVWGLTELQQHPTNMNTYLRGPTVHATDATWYNLDSISATVCHLWTFIVI